MIQSIGDFAPEGEEAGVGLALRDTQGRYLFMLAGTRHRCPPGELFYAGIGGHREEGEDWISCAHREVQEEIDSAVEIESAHTTLHIPHGGPIQHHDILDRPRPMALYDMIHPPHTPRAGELYHIVVYRAKLRRPPQNLPPDELLGVIALSRDQVVSGRSRKPTIKALLDEGAEMVIGGETLDSETRLYPIGTAHALSYVLELVG